MSSQPTNQPKLANVRFSIESDDFCMESEVTIPAGPTRVSDLLPLARALSDAVIGETCRAVEAAGAFISCKPGCGACCRNLVAISEVESRRVGKLVEKLPEPRRSIVRARFSEARDRLAQAGLLETLQGTEGVREEEYDHLVGSYFGLGIACPFLEEESCSIYSERPITCREYLVTSPPKYCGQLGSDKVERVRLPLRVFNAVARWQVSPAPYFLERWVPLILAPEWAEAHPDDPPPKSGPDLLRELLDNLNA